MQPGVRRLTQRVGLVLGVTGLHALVLWLLSMGTEPVHTSPSTLWLEIITPPPITKLKQKLPDPQIQATHPPSEPAVVSHLKKISKPDSPDQLQGDAVDFSSTNFSPTNPHPFKASMHAESALATKETHNSVSQVLSSQKSVENVLPTTQLPSNTADYLNNPPPAYPAISLRLGEQGKVVIRVLIGKEGLAHQGSIHQSSGFDRLDQAALRAVMSWRYLPGIQAGSAQDMWFDVPVNFTLN